jgi:hypothetical protein
MHTAITFVTAAAFAVHALFGCCLHHTHVHAASAQATDEGKLHQHARHVHSHVHGPEHAAEPGHQPDSKTPCIPECDESGCSFLSVAKVAAPELDQAGSTVDSLLGVSNLGQHLAADGWRKMCAAGNVHPPSLRRHLEYCVLLI